jgi:aspartate--ammonia ligase
MIALAMDYFLDHDHSVYIDQWDGERVISPAERNVDFLKEIVGKIWKVLVDAERYAQELFPDLRAKKYPNPPDKLTFLHAEDLLKMHADLPRKQRETAMLQECPALFIVGIGYPLDDGYPHEMRAADYGDCVTETTAADGKKLHGLNGDILVWNHATRRRHELSSMGIRVNVETLKKQLEMSGQTDFLKSLYHQGIIKNEIPRALVEESGRHAP